jgi:hypothetical protein
MAFTASKWSVISITLGAIAGGDPNQPFTTTFSQELIDNLPL